MNLSMRGGLLTVAAALVVGCGGAGDGNNRSGTGTAAGGSTSQGSPVDACSLLTADEIGRMLGEAIGAPRHAPDSVPASICQWPSIGDEPLMPFVQISITANTASSYDDWMAGMAREMGQPLDAAEHPPVDEIGDWAVYVVDSRTLIVAVGPQLVHVMVDPYSAGVEAIALAELAVSRFPR